MAGFFKILVLMLVFFGLCLAAYDYVADREEKSMKDENEMLTAANERLKSQVDSIRYELTDGYEEVLLKLVNIAKEESPEKGAQMQGLVDFYTAQVFHKEEESEQDKTDTENAEQ